MIQKNLNGLPRRGQAVAKLFILHNLVPTGKGLAKINDRHDRNRVVLCQYSHQMRLDISSEGWCDSMKVYLSVDMEGVAGVVSWDQVTPGSPEYAHARRWMIEEANAAIAGAYEAGATHVLVNDSHNGMRNLLHHELDPRATLLSGGLKQYGMMAGLDDTFDAAIFVGYHARGGAPGVLAHTWSSSVIGVRLNGQEVGEWGLNAMMAGAFGVPVVMVTGDDCVAAEVHEGLPGPVETVVVKWALTKYAAQHLPRVEAVQAIREGAARALGKVRQIPPFQPQLPVTLEVDLNATQLADSAAMMPKAERRGPLTVRYTAEDGLEAFHAFLTFMALASYAD